MFPLGAKLFPVFALFLHIYSGSEVSILFQLLVTQISNNLETA